MTATGLGGKTVTKKINGLMVGQIFAKYSLLCILGEQSEKGGRGRQEKFCNESFPCLVLMYEF